MSCCENIQITHTFTYGGIHTRFRQKYLPLEPGECLRSTGSFSNLLVNPIFRDNSSDIKMHNKIKVALIMILQKLIRVI